MPINVEPNLDKPIPEGYLVDTKTETLGDHVRVMGNTAVLLNELGADYDMSDDDIEQASEMMKKVKVDASDKTKEPKSGEKKDLKAAASQPGVALALGGFVSHYDKQVIQDKIQLRNIAINTFLTVLQESDDEKNRLKAAEMLGKAGDLFTEKAEITITHRTSDELKEAIRERIKTLIEMQQKLPEKPNEKRMGELDVVDVETKEVKTDGTDGS
jgi:small-conductance mechanosensitive channel